MRFQLAIEIKPTDAIKGAEVKVGACGIYAPVPQVSSEQRMRD